MSTETHKLTLASTASAQIIAAGIVIAFLYWAASVAATILVSVLLAAFAEPIVAWLEQWHVRRVFGSFLVVLLILALFGALGWVLVDRIDHFWADWPKYRAPLRHIAEAIQAWNERLESRFSEVTPPQPRGPQLVQVSAHPVRDALFAKLSSLYTIILAVSFVPFLLFFMLAGRHRMWHATMQLFPERDRTAAKETLEEVGRALRRYVAGGALVGMILVVTTWLFFWAFGLDFPLLTALVSGLLNLVPYLGAVLSWLPPLMIGLKQYHTLAPFIGICAVLSGLHLVTANLLLPAIVGHRVRLNALAVTVALLFWGWLWGAMGLILAIPITAIMKVICDHVERWRPVGRWLGA